MRKFQTALFIGLFLGVIFIMSHQMLILFVIYADFAKSSEDGPEVRAAERAMAAFSFFLFLLYSVFGTLLATFRNDIIAEQTTSDRLANENETGIGAREEEGDNEEIASAVPVEKL